MQDFQPDSALQLAMYRKMLTIRRFEERCNYLFMQGKIPSTLHLYIGQEAVATGVCAHLSDADYATSTHRPHGHSIAKGVSLRSIMAELYAKRTGCCKGKGGSMHVGDMTVGMIPAIAIVGGNIPLTAGLALACKRRGEGRVAVAFMGDGATNEGAFHEGLNMAAIWDLPALFVVENNLYAASTPVGVTFKIENIADRAGSYGMASDICDGMDVLAVYEAAGRAIAPRPCWRRADPAGVQDVPAVRPLAQRPAHLPVEGRGSGVGDARCDLAPGGPSESGRPRHRRLAGPGRAGSHRGDR